MKVFVAKRIGPNGPYHSYHGNVRVPWFPASPEALRRSKYDKQTIIDDEEQRKRLQSILDKD